MKEISKKTGVTIWTFISIFLGIGYALICKKFNIYHNNLFIERTILISLISELFGLQVIIGFRNFWNFIIEKRYIIALICLVLFTVFGISGSSMGATNTWLIEPDKDNTILGSYRYIRSDEYAVEVPFTTAQKNTGMNNFLDVNGINETNMNISVHCPTKMFLLFRIYNIGYLFLPLRMAFSFAWNLRIIALILVTYEFLNILTDKKKYLSLIATIIISCSSFINWWMGMAIDILLFGELCLLALDKFMLSKNKKYKIIWSAAFAYSFISYVFILYPAWQISFGYIFLALAIWIIIKNRKEYKFEKIDIVCFLGILLLIGVFGSIFYSSSKDAIQSILNSSYPGARNETGGNGLSYLFSYLYSFMLPFISNINTVEYASFLSVFPVPMIIAMIYIYKEEKHAEFIFPLLVVLVLETIWCLSGIPSTLAKITMLNLVPVERCAVSIGLGSIYLYVFMLDKIDKKIMKQTASMYITLGVLAFLALIPLPKGLGSRKYLLTFVIIESVLAFLLLNIGDKKYKNVFLFFAVVGALISGIFVNPIVIGVNPITQTDFAKVVQEEVAKNPEGLWITEDMGIPVTNYLVAQGAKTLNATQTYPNETLWKEILGEKAVDFRDIWNRYSHIKVQVSNNKVPYIDLLTEDCIEIYLSKDTIKDLDVQYIVSYKDDLDTNLNMKKIYEKKAKEETIIEGQKVSGIYIYEFVN